MASDGRSARDERGRALAPKDLSSRYWSDLADSWFGHGCLPDEDRRLYLGWFEGAGSEVMEGWEEERATRVRLPNRRATKPRPPARGLTRRRPGPDSRERPTTTADVWDGSHCPSPSRDAADSSNCHDSSLANAACAFAHLIGPEAGPARVLRERSNQDQTPKPGTRLPAVRCLFAQRPLRGKAAFILKLTLCD